MDRNIQDLPTGTHYQKVRAVFAQAGILDLCNFRETKWRQYMLYIVGGVVMTRQEWLDWIGR